MNKGMNKCRGLCPVHNRWISFTRRVVLGTTDKTVERRGTFVQCGQVAKEAQ